MIMVESITSLDDLKELVNLFEKKNIFYSIFAGFAFDALRGKISRHHKDADVLVLKRDFNKIKAIVSSLGYVFDRIADRLIIRKSNSARADLEMVTIEGDFGLIRGKSKAVSIPLELIMNVQRKKLDGVEFNISSNEILKLWGLYDRKGYDLNFAKSLKINQKLFDKIKID